MKNSLRILLIVTALIFIVFCFLINNAACQKNKAKHVEAGSIPYDAEIIFWSTRNIPKAHILAPSMVYTVDRDGGNVTQITFTPYHYEHIAVSPDRTHIVAARKDPGQKETSLWLIDLVNKIERQLVPGFSTAGDGGVDWSIDNRIYFRGRRKKPKGKKSFGLSEIYSINPDGTKLKKLTHTPKMEVFDVSVSEDGTMVTHVGISPVKSPQGTMHAKPQIWVLNSDGSNHKMVDDGGDEYGTYGLFPIGDFDPEISPDNKYVVFSRTNTQVPPNFPNTLKTAHDIWIAPIDKSSPAKRITKPGPISIIPDWKDGVILYTEYDDKKRYVGLATIKPDGTGKKRLELGQHKNLLDGGRHGKWIP